MAIYKINTVIFDTELCTLACAGDVSPLDPKLAALLVFFIDNQGDILSRDALLDNVWQDSIVSDNTINWSISQLRKALQDDAKSPTFIKTISKKGYQFVAKVDDIVEQPEDSAKPSAKDKAKSVLWYLLPACLLVLLVILAFFSQQQWQPSTTQVTASLPLTSMPGHERGGRVSQDGRLLAFIHMPLGHSRYQVYLKPLKENVKLPVIDDNDEQTGLKDSKRNLSAAQITRDDFNYSQVIWGEDEYQLIAVRGNAGICEVVLLSLAPDRQQVAQLRTIASCKDGLRTKVALARNQTLLYIVGALEQSTKRDLYSVDLNTQVQTKLLEASNHGTGFKFVDVNDDSGALLLLQDMYLRETTFVIFEPSSGKLTSLFHLESPYWTAYWGNTADKIWYNWGNQTVVEYRLSNKSVNTVLTTSVGWNYDFHPISSSQAIYTVSDGDAANLAFIQNDQVDITPTSYTESGPVFSAKSGKLAYVSNQSGLPQIWLRTDTQTVQITDIENYTEFYDLAWSLDENSLIAVAGKNIGVLALDRNRFRILSRAKHKPFRPSISVDKAYYAYARFADGRWSVGVFKDDGSEQSTSAIAELPGANKGVFIDNNRLVYSANKKQGLSIYNVKEKYSAVLWQGLPENAQWQISDSALLYSHDGSIFKCRLFEPNECAEKTPHERIASYPGKLKGHFSYDRQSGQVVMVDTTKDETNLRIAEISP